MLPNCGSGKSYIRETTRLTNQWVEGSPLKDIAMKQKPSKNSKSKDHIKALERRMLLCHKGKLEELFSEVNAIQSQLKSK